tara:strand:- start:39 stop:749 length:711 start_codon:yes stop_codon:yes gene_type:complete
MILIDTIYQKVLALANKEQRGYITPQEFNLLADKAQMDIYANYFHNLKMAYHKPTATQIGIAGDEMEMLQAKLHPFKTNTVFTQVANDASASLPFQLYFIDVLYQNNNEVAELTKKEIAYTENNPLLRATTNRMVYVREHNDGTNNVITMYPTPVVDTEFDIHYYRIPSTPMWTYVVVNSKPLFNNQNSINFELHISEEERLVTRILELSGLVIRSEELAQAALVDKGNTKQEQNS